ncbi:methyl-accepting chemotaxis protein [Rhodoferax aquaticus]|uniref:Methyl-accepting chemotaxis protein n=1 Tax=Rhodoferax aquaticus TaxID=2527691 RepID=A0A515ERM6_9BURK|nr:methyl-accepting chemotaxis protein [Rhodoferax aquaticus]QDL55273.1 methyl-accepting chemotaxis protein [Rhodoferax aquaticus]
MKKLSIRAQLTWAFGVLASLVLLISGFAWHALNASNDNLEHFVNGVNARAALAARVRQAIDLRAIAARDLVIASTPEDLAQARYIVRKAHEDVATSLAQLKKLAEVPDVAAEARSLIANIDRIEKAYAPVALDIVDKALHDKRDEAIAKINGECRPLLAALITLTSDYAELTATHSAQDIEAAEAGFANQRNLLVGVCLVALFSAVLAGISITRSLDRSLGAEPAELNAIVDRIAHGDLAIALAVHAKDRSSVLATMARMQRSLAEVVSRVRKGSESVSTASAEIAHGSQDLSARTESQASALEQTAASMEELSAQVKHNADNALQAKQLASSASAVALRGGEVVGRVVNTMQEINESSRKIFDIISVIDGIAFQTNILAVNAAVEAARAGDEGRGFAVVASEVRALAGRSSAAAKEIKSLISASVEKVEHGTDLVDEAGTTMTEVVTSIRRVSDLVGEISAASSEQAAGVAQVGEALTQMEQTTQQNAVLVEQMAAAASSLKAQAQKLVQVVAVFKVGRIHLALSHNTSAPTRTPASPWPKSPFPAALATTMVHAKPQQILHT